MIFFCACAYSVQSVSIASTRIPPPRYLVTSVLRAKTYGNPRFVDRFPNHSSQPIMAATKHRLAEDAQPADPATRPSKKSKVDAESEDVSPEEKARLKKERKEKKKAKKEKKKAVESAPESVEDASAEDVEMADTQPAKEKKSKKDKKDKKDKSAKKEKSDTKVESEPAPAVASAPVLADDDATYVQTLSLSEVPQSEIDAFLTTHEISTVDPLTDIIALRPVTEFRHLPATNLLERRPSPFANFKAPTPIQAASWPFTLSGRDAVGVAETGSGKTMAFALPCVESVSAIGGKGVKAVIVSPTRELAMQTQEQLSKLAALVRLKSVCIYGGASKDDQRALLKKGADIIVATPGRLKDFMSDDTINLGGAKFVVLDEADRMLDKGFEEDIKMILGSCPAREKRQTLMFTATWPASVQAIASTFMINPIKITIGSGGKETASGAVELQANSRISQSVEVLEPREKEFRLLQIIKEHQQGKNKNDRILVFCLYKKEATRVEQTLSRKGVRVGGIHGDLRQEQRTRSLEAFKSGQTPVLVATDVAARGLDIPEVKLVINCTVSLPQFSHYRLSHHPPSGSRLTVNAVPSHD